MTKHLQINYLFYRYNEYIQSFDESSIGEKTIFVKYEHETTVWEWYLLKMNIKSQKRVNVLTYEKNLWRSALIIAFECSFFSHKFNRAGI